MADVLVIASLVYFYGVSAQLKALIDRLHTPMRNEFKLKKLALILVGAAALPELFDAIKVQYRLVLNYFKLEDAGTVFVRGAKDKGDVKIQMHCMIFRNSIGPQFCVTFEADITYFKEKVKKQGLSFTMAMVYAVCKCAIC